MEFSHDLTFQSIKFSSTLLCSLEFALLSKFNQKICFHVFAFRIIYKFKPHNSVTTFPVQIINRRIKEYRVLSNDCYQLITSLTSNLYNYILLEQIVQMYVLKDVNKFRKISGRGNSISKLLQKIIKLHYSRNTIYFRLK